MRPSGASCHLAHSRQLELVLPGRASRLSHFEGLPTSLFWVTFMGIKHRINVTGPKATLRLGPVTLNGPHERINVPIPKVAPIGAAVLYLAVAIYYLIRRR